MARPSNKSKEQRIAELQAKIASIEANSLNSEFAQSGPVSKLLNMRDTLNTQVREAKMGLFSTVPNLNLSNRMDRYRARMDEIRTEARFSECVLRYSESFNSTLDGLISEAISKLGKGESESSVQEWINAGIEAFQSNNPELCEEYEIKRTEYLSAHSKVKELIMEGKNALRAPKGRRKEGESETADVQSILSDILN